MTSPSPFIDLPQNRSLLSNELAFAIFDGFPVAPGDSLALTKRLVPTWFEATAEQQAAMMSLVNEVDDNFLRTLNPVPDGSQWVFKFVKIACNVSTPLGSEENQIRMLLRGWFDENAGAPGTNYQVAFNKTESGWYVDPIAVASPLRVVDTKPVNGESDAPGTQDLPRFVEAPAAKDKFTRLVPIHSLEAAAGQWGPESTPEEIGWAEAPGATIKPGMFIALVRGRSMEPKIKDGTWNLFRPCPQGSREGRIVLVQFNFMGDPENGGRFTVKKYHSAKTIFEDAWQHDHIELLPLNPDCAPIIVAPHDAAEMVVVGEWVASIDD